jgi:hypothetical protein
MEESAEERASRGREGQVWFFRIAAFVVPFIVFLRERSVP